MHTGDSANLFGARTRIGGRRIPGYRERRRHLAATNADQDAAASVASGGPAERASRLWPGERAAGKRRAAWYSNSQHAYSTRGYIETRANAF